VRSTSLRVGDLEMDLVERTVYCVGTKIELLPRKFDLLEYFLRRPGQMITRAMLLQNVWKYRFSIETNVVDTQVSNSRKKIDMRRFPSRILSMRKVGFMVHFAKLPLNEEQSDRVRYTSARGTNERRRSG
jgi:two-component system, OmpR family, response regulator